MALLLAAMAEIEFGPGLDIRLRCCFLNLPVMAYIADCTVVRVGCGAGRAWRKNNFHDGGG